MTELEGVDDGAGGSSCVSSEKKFICRLFRTLNLQGCGSLACRTELNIIGSIQDMKRTCRYSVHQAISTCYKLHLFSEYTAQQPLPLLFYLKLSLSLSLFLSTATQQLPSNARSTHYILGMQTRHAVLVSKQT